MSSVSPPVAAALPGIVELADAIRAGTMTATHAVEACLERIEAYDGDVNSFVYLDPDGALVAAAAIDARVAAGEDPGPLCGVPFGIKDLRDRCAGMPTRNGSLFDADAEAAVTDSEHIARLRRAGAIPLGKVATAEFGMDGVTHTLAHGTTRNPWNLSRTPSGSSGGSSAAVAAGLVPFCTASDGGGSTRCPAGYTGTVGLKPSMGRIPRLAGFSDHSCLGAITRSVRDTARYLDAVSGPCDEDRMSLPAEEGSYETLLDKLPLQGRRVAWSLDYGFAPVAPDVARVTAEAYSRLVAAAGLEPADVNVSLPNVYMDTNMRLCDGFVASLESRGILPDHIDQLSPGPRAFVEMFYGQFDKHLRDRSLAKEQQVEQIFARLFREVDFLASPCHARDAYDAEGPLPVSIAGRDSSQTHAEPFTMAANIAWNPSISVPAGLSDDGLPIGLLITARRHHDALLLALAARYEKHCPWPLLAPGYERNGK